MLASAQGDGGVKQRAQNINLWLCPMSRIFHLFHTVFHLRGNRMWQTDFKVAPEKSAIWFSHLCIIPSPRIWWGLGLACSQ